jgi:hypothetical protein
MMSLFPALFDFSLIAVFLLRVTTGIFFLLFGLHLLRATYDMREKSLTIQGVGLAYGFSKLLVGFLLTAGVYTQAAAIMGALLALLTLAQAFTTEKNVSAQQVQILLFVLCLSLLFLGPGLFAFDIPL